MACLDEALRREPTALAILNEDPRRVQTLDVLVEQHDVAPAAEGALQPAVVAMVGQKEKTVGVARREALQRLEFPVDPVAGTAKDHAVTVVAGARLDGACELGEERVADVGGRQSDQLGGALQKALGDDIGVIVQIANCAIDFEPPSRSAT